MYKPHCQTFTVTDHTISTTPLPTQHHPHLVAVLMKASGGEDEDSDDRAGMGLFCCCMGQRAGKIGPVRLRPAEVRLGFIVVRSARLPSVADNASPVLLGQLSHATNKLMMMPFWGVGPSLFRPTRNPAVAPCCYDVTICWVAMGGAWCHRRRLGHGRSWLV